MDTRAYRLECLKQCDVYEIDFPEVMQMKDTLLQAAMESIDDASQLMLTAKSLKRISVDIRDEDWFKQLQASGFIPEKNTLWILEGIIYYLPHSQAMEVLKTIANHCSITHTVLLGDFMNKQSTTLSATNLHFYSDWPEQLLPTLGFSDPKPWNITHTVLLGDFMNKQSTTLSATNFHFYSDWPEQLLPTLGFSDVTLSQIGDPDADYGLFHDPLNLFNRLRGLPRSIQNHPDDGTPCCRLYLVQASGSPKNQTISRNGSS
ncbi:Leucine carboxyl methyltransferase [Artemisia annua]|uniref:Leucine carboxyl methyltransferase n=1 Tax=Artemisia annua TaxID=35608 RepID=A0A2U1PK59_ARTAN|nr:Leucine carboxyl methyltransferase [Artemisia annua]